MMNILRVALAVAAGIVLGSIVNMALVMVGPVFVPPPPGVDVTSPQSIAATMHLFEPEHFIPPFVAHALGALAGALTGHLVASRHRTAVAYAVGATFLAGGVAASMMIPAPTWFIALDLIVAYLPMAWLAIRLGRRIRPEVAAGAA